MKTKILSLISILFLFTLIVAMKSPSSESPLYGMVIVLKGGNGTPDGAQAHRDYVWELKHVPPVCSIYSFEVINQSSTGYHSSSGNLLAMWWKPSYVGTTQTVRAECTCLDFYGNYYTETVTKNVTIHN